MRRCIVVRKDFSWEWWCGNYFAPKLWLNTRKTFCNFLQWRSVTSSLKLQQEEYGMTFGLSFAQLKTSSLSFPKNVSRSIQSLFGYCKKKQYLCYKHFMQIHSMCRLLAFVKILSIAFFTNIKPFLINAYCVFKINKKNLAMAIQKTFSNAHPSLFFLFW